MTISDEFEFDNFEFDDTPGESTEKTSKKTEPKSKEGGEGKREEMIPKERFDAELARLRGELEQLKAPKAAEKQQRDPIADLQAHIEAMEDELDDATEASKRKELRQKIRAARTQYDALREQRTTTAASSISSEQVAYAATVKSIEEQYPQLNSQKKDAYDEALTNDVIALMQGLVQNGMNRSEALQKAVTRLVPQPAANPKSSRDTASRLRNASAMNQQPPNSNKVGTSLTNKDGGLTDTIDEAKLEKMDAHELAILRGDFLD